MNWADYPIEFLPNQVYERNLNDLTNDLIEFFFKNVILSYSSSRVQQRVPFLSV